MDLEIEKLARFRRSRTGRKRGHNAARDFHRWAHRAGHAFPVRLSHVPITIHKRLPVKSGRKARDVPVDYPVLHLSSWLASLMEKFPKFLLGGHNPALGAEPYEEMFEQFWCKFKSANSSHPIYSRMSAEQRRRAIPFALHGDEGRGLAKVPLLIMSFQVLIPYSGPDQLNLNKQLDETR